MQAAREAAHAFVHSDRPEEAFQFALDRVGPVVGAAFGSVYLIDGASELMRLVAAHNWPEKHRPWLSDVRVRVGFGPSGEAASERRVIEVPDVFADPGLEDWQDVARELGFVGLVSLPLQSASGTLGTLTFYFHSWDGFTGERRDLLRLLADLMGAAAEKSRLLDRARRAEAGAVEALGELDRQYAAVADARRSGYEVVDLALGALRDAADALELAVGFSPAGRATALSGRLDDVRAQQLDLMLLAELVADLIEPEVAAFDPHAPLRDAIATVARPEGAMQVESWLDGDLAPIRTDRRLVTLLLAKLVSRATASRESGEARAWIVASAARIEYHLPGQPGNDVKWRLATALAAVLGGAVEAVAGEGEGSERLVVALPLDGPRRGTPPAHRRNE